MQRPFLTFSQSDYLIQIVDINSHTYWQTIQIQISWFLKKPTDLDLHCSQRQGISRLSRNWVKHMGKFNRRQISTIWVKYQNLLSGKNKKKYFKMSAEIFNQHANQVWCVMRKRMFWVINQQWFIVLVRGEYPDIFFLIFPWKHML